MLSISFKGFYKKKLILILTNCSSGIALHIGHLLMSSGHKFGGTEAGALQKRGSLRGNKIFIYSQLSRHSTARGSGDGLVPIGPTKVKAS